MHFRKRFALAAALATGLVLGTMLVAGGAAADTNISRTGDNTDPQTTNIPYLAWAGEQLRLVKCYPAGDTTTGLTAQFSVVSWSGDLGPNTVPRPEVESNTASFVTDESTGRICARGDVTSQYAGLAQIKLVVTDASGAIVKPKHDFLAVWMNITTPQLTELAGGGDNGTSVFNLGIPAQRDAGLVGVTIKGTFPFNGATWTMPDQWAALAAQLAVDNDNPANPGPLQGAGPTMRWDIHDDNSLAEGHPVVTGCSPIPAGEASAPLTGTARDGVDNCAGGGPSGDVFSRLFGINMITGAALGDHLGSGTGPFDPTFSPTLLSDGKLDQFDAPMPAAPIYLYLSGNVGALDKASKDEIFSRNGTGGNTAHNLYAPYYSEWIPSTSRADSASGVDGPAAGNNFPGFLNEQGVPYEFWTPIVQVTRGGGRTDVNRCNDASGNGVKLPNGPTQIVVYTDEHGQAVAEFDPTAGFGLTVGGNNRCAAFAGPASFTANIKAEAKYPFQVPVPGQTQLLANPVAGLTKTVNTVASKVLSCVPKGLNEAFCVETIRDLFGELVPGARVRFNANSLGNVQIQADSTAFGPFDTNGQVVDDSTTNESQVDLRTNILGQAGVLITDSLSGDCVNVRAENRGTRFGNNPGISVFTDFNPALGAACVAGPTGVSTVTNPPAGGGTTIITPPIVIPTAKATVSGGNNNNNNTGGTSNAGTTAPVIPVIPAATTALNGAPTIVSASGKAKATVSITVAKLMTIGNGRFLGLNLKSTAKTAQVRITLVGINGTVIGHVVKTVKTNQLVRVMKLGAAVRSVRVSPIVV